MRKGSFLVSLILLVALVGCTATTSAPSAVPPTNTPAQAGQETKAPSTSTPQPPTLTAAPEPTWKADGTIGVGEYKNQVESSGVTFYWSNDASFLYAAMSASTKGWVSIGFDPVNKMQGANYIFGYVKDGQASVEDMFGTRPFGPGAHPADTELGGKNDIAEFAGKEEGGTTVIEFKIPLDSGDANDKPLTPGQTYPIIVAIGGRDDFNSAHSARGYAQINID